jgi:nucleoside-diphosphate-sugar epimerase
MSQNRTVLITGAAGGVGRTICRLLHAEGFAVRGLVRPEDDPSVVPLPRRQLTVGYVQHPEAVAQALQGADAVVHCAALLPNAVHLGDAAFQEVNVGGSVNVLKQAARLGIPQALFFSTIGVVDHHTRKITHDTLQEYVAGTGDPYLRSKIDAEKELLRLQPNYRGALDILRPAFIYGPGNFAVWKDGLGLVRQGKMKLIGDGQAPLPLIYAEDIARLVLALLRRPAPGPVWAIRVLASPEPTSFKDVFDFIADYLAVPRPKRVPQWAVSLTANLASLLPEPLRLGRLKLLTRARALQYSRGYDLSGVLDPDFLGQVPLTGYRTGLPRMLDDYLQHHNLRRSA